MATPKEVDALRRELAGIYISSPSRDDRFNDGVVVLHMGPSPEGDTLRGTYERGTGIIEIFNCASRTKGDIMSTFAHEFTHFLQEYDTVRAEHWFRRAQLLLPQWAKVGIHRHVVACYHEDDYDTEVQAFSVQTAWELRVNPKAAEKRARKRYEFYS